MIPNDLEDIIKIMRRKSKTHASVTVSSAQLTMLADMLEKILKKLQTEKGGGQ